LPLPPFSIIFAAFAFRHALPFSMSLPSPRRFHYFSYFASDTDAAMPLPLDICCCHCAILIRCCFSLLPLRHADMTPADACHTTLSRFIYFMRHTSLGSHSGHFFRHFPFTDFHFLYSLFRPYSHQPYY